MENLINIVNNPWFFSSVAGILGLYVVSLSVILAVWTARDIKQRTRNAAARLFAPAFVLLFGFAGFVPYIVLRPRQTFAERSDERRDLLLLAEAAKKFECPKCFAAVERDFAYCPSCAVQFKPVCQCGATVEQSWKRCAYCATPLAAELAGKALVAPIPSIELPPAVEPAKTKATRLTKGAKTGLLKKKARFGLRLRRAKKASSLQESVPALANMTVRATGDKSVKGKRLGFGGLTKGWRRALAIKR